MKKEIIYTISKILLGALIMFLIMKACKKSIQIAPQPTENVKVEVAKVEKAENKDSLRNLVLVQENKELNIQLDWLYKNEIEATNNYNNFRIRVANKASTIITSPCPSVEEKQDFISDIDTMQQLCQVQVESCQQSKVNLEKIIVNQGEIIASKNEFQSQLKNSFDKVVAENIMLSDSNIYKQGVIRVQTAKIKKQTKKLWTWRFFGLGLGTGAYFIIKNNIK